MSLWPVDANPYIGALISGLFYGTVFCTSSCLPYISSYIAGINADFKKGITATLIFNFGRVAAYAIMGAAIGLLGFALSATNIAPFQQYSSLAFGLVSIIIGAYMLFKIRSKSHNCPAVNAEIKPKKAYKHIDFGAFTLGFSRGFVLCLPLVSLLAYSVAFASPIESVALAVLFGLGTAVSPMLLLGGVTGWLLNKAPLLQKWISIGGAGILILLGLSSWIGIFLASGT
jgi:cytochrome c-type biogenesis protein